MPVRAERKVVAHHIDNHGRKHQSQRYPELPIMMRACPVWASALMVAVMILLAMVAVTTLILVH
jgi:type VI protein secretion system component VasF